VPTEIEDSQIIHIPKVQLSVTHDRSFEVLRNIQRKKDKLAAFKKQLDLGITDQAKFVKETS